MFRFYILLFIFIFHSKLLASNSIPRRPIFDEVETRQLASGIRTNTAVSSDGSFKMVSQSSNSSFGMISPERLTPNISLAIPRLPLTVIEPPTHDYIDELSDSGYESEEGPRSYMPRRRCINRPFPNGSAPIGIVHPNNHLTTWTPPTPPLSPMPEPSAPYSPEATASSNYTSFNTLINDRNLTDDEKVQLRDLSVIYGASALNNEEPSRNVINRFSEISDRRAVNSVVANVELRELVNILQEANPGVNFDIDVIAERIRNNEPFPTLPRPPTPPTPEPMDISPINIQPMVNPIARIDNLEARAYFSEVRLDPIGAEANFPLIVDDGVPVVHPLPDLITVPIVPIVAPAMVNADDEVNIIFVDDIPVGAEEVAVAPVIQEVPGLMLPVPATVQAVQTVQTPVVIQNVDGVPIIIPNTANDELVAVMRRNGENYKYMRNNFSELIHDLFNSSMFDSDGYYTMGMFSNYKYKKLKANTYGSSISIGQKNDMYGYSLGLGLIRSDLRYYDSKKKINTSLLSLRLQYFIDGNNTLNVVPSFAFSKFGQHYINNYNLKTYIETNFNLKQINMDVILGADSHFCKNNKSSNNTNAMTKLRFFKVYDKGTYNFEPSFTVGMYAPKNILYLNHRLKIGKNDSFGIIDFDVFAKKNNYHFIVSSKIQLFF